MVKQVQQQEPVEQDNHLDRTVFISGIPYDTTDDMIQQFFKKCGEIEQMNIPKYQDSNRCRGYAHITFVSKKSIKEAIKLDHQYLGKRFIEVKPATGKKQTIIKNEEKEIPQDCKTIFVKGLPYSMNEDQFGELFIEFGEIENARISYNHQNKQSKGFGYIEFKNQTSLKKALSMNGYNYQGRNLVVDFDTDQRKQGYKLKYETEGNEKFNKEVKDKINKKVKKTKKIEKAVKKIKNIQQSSLF